jgi:HD superfamily phosphohydrolase
MLGVCWAGGSREEQVAGLLHDVSHTAFSHVIDHVVANSREDYHELRVQEWIARTEIPTVLAYYRMDVAPLLDAALWPLVDRPAPDLCLDRIDYTLRDLLHCGRVTEPEVSEFVGSLTVQEERIVVDSLAQALWFVQRYHEEVTDLFMDPVESYANASMGQAIRVGLEQGVITDEDLFLEDEQLLGRLRSARLASVTEALARLRPSLLVSKSGPAEGALHVRHKYRVVDPLVRVQPGVFVRCSELDPGVRELHNQVREQALGGSWLAYAGPGLLSG